MEQKDLLRLLILFLGFSYVLSSRPVPLPASLKPVNEDPSVQDLVEHGLMEQRYHKEVSELEEGYISGRMDLESNDYKEPRANPRHDPKTPGSV